VVKALPALGAYGVKHGNLASVIVAMVVWMIMPRYTRLVHNWLFRKE
jgi:antibiotic biosynthesis monooxygenase (ABM) superfamily enzyme